MSAWKTRVLVYLQITMAIIYLYKVNFHAEIFPFFLVNLDI